MFGNGTKLKHKAAVVTVPACRFAPAADHQIPAGNANVRKHVGIDPRQGVPGF